MTVFLFINMTVFLFTRDVHVSVLWDVMLGVIYTSSVCTDFCTDFCTVGRLGACKYTISFIITSSVVFLLMKAQCFNNHSYADTVKIHTKALQLYLCENKP